MQYEGLDITKKPFMWEKVPLYTQGNGDFELAMCMQIILTHVVVVVVVAYGIGYSMCP